VTWPSPLVVRSIAEDIVLPEEAQRSVARIGKRVTPEDVDDYVRKKETRDRSHYLRTWVTAWKEQQAEERKMRKSYASWLLRLMTGQILAINAIFILMGCGLLTVERWAASTFIVASFAEVAGLILIVVKYLFPTSSSQLPPIGGRSATGGTRGVSKGSKTERSAGKS
jgi:hypothetical protein